MKIDLRFVTSVNTLTLAQPKFRSLNKTITKCDKFAKYLAIKSRNVARFARNIVKISIDWYTLYVVHTMF